MKTSFIFILSLKVASSIVCAGVTIAPGGISVEGAIEGGLTDPLFSGDTIDYLTFRVTTAGPVRLIATDITNAIFLAMGEDVGGGEPFDSVGLPYLLFDNSSRVNPPEFTHILQSGFYLVQVAEEEFRDGDLYPYGFLPVNRSGGGFVASPYSFTLEGQFEVLDFMEGNLDGTFTVTHVPEPSIATLISTAVAVIGFAWRRRS